MNTGSIKAAIIQASPVYSDLPASFNKAVDLIRTAAAQGAKLITHVTQPSL